MHSSRMSKLFMCKKYFTDKASDPKGSDTPHAMSTRKSSKGQLLHKLKEKERSQLYSVGIIVLNDTLNAPVVVNILRKKFMYIYVLCRRI